MNVANYHKNKQEVFLMKGDHDKNNNLCV